MEDLAYWVLFPAIILINVGTSDFSAMPVMEITISVLGTFSLLAILCLVLQPFLKQKFAIEGPRFTSIFQGVVRWNGFVAMAIAANSFGEEGVALVAVIMAIMIPAANLLCVIVLSIYAGGSVPSPKTLAKELIKNPFIISVAAGGLINASGGYIPEVIANYLTFWEVQPYQLQFCASVQLWIWEHCVARAQRSHQLCFCATYLHRALP